MLLNVVEFLVAYLMRYIAFGNYNFSFFFNELFLEFK